MRLDQLLIAIAVFLLFASVGIIFMFGDTESTGFFQTYEVNASSTEMSKVNYGATSIYNISSQEKDDLFTQDVTATTSWESLIVGGYKVLRNFGSTFNIIGNIANNIIGTLGIPPIFGTFLMILVGISVIFAMIYLIFRFFPPGG